MNDDYETSMSVPVDEDGFLRRQCPTCERELKWLAAEEEDEEPLPEPEAGYYCPYCAIQAPGDSWWTEAQLQMAQSILVDEVVGTALDKFKRQVEGMNTGGLISFSVETDTPEPADPLTEINDMRRVDFACHRGASVKVLDDWDREVHCTICGTVAGAA